MEWINTIIGSCILVLFLVDKFYWSKNRFAMLDAHIKLLQDQAAKASEIKAHADIIGKEYELREKRILEEKERDAKEFSKRIEQLLADSKQDVEFQFKLITELKQYKDKVKLIEMQEEADREAYNEYLKKYKEEIEDAAEHMAEIHRGK